MNDRIEKRGFSHIRASHNGKLWQPVGGTFLGPDTALHELELYYLPVAVLETTTSPFPSLNKLFPLSLSSKPLLRPSLREGGVRSQFKFDFEPSLRGKIEPIPGAEEAGAARTRGTQINGRNWKTKRETATNPWLPMNLSISQVHQCDCSAHDGASSHG